MTPRISLVAFEARIGQFIFVAVPNERGRYLKTDKSVAIVACSQCRSAIGEPCKANGGTEDGYATVTHVARRVAAMAKHRGPADDDIIDPVGVESMGMHDVPVARGGDHIELIEPRPAGGTP